MNASERSYRVVLWASSHTGRVVLLASLERDADDADVDGVMLTRVYLPDVSTERCLTTEHVSDAAGEESLTDRIPW